MRRIVLGISVVALVLSVAWFIAQPGYEPAITFLLGVAGIISSRVSRSRNPREGDAGDGLLRPHRLEARNALLAFADSCIRYQTLHPQREMNRTSALCAEIARLKSDVEALGPLSMSELDPLLTDVVSHAWNFQRLLDRQGGPDPRPINPEYATLEDNLDGIVDWFVNVKKRIKTEIDPHLEM